MIITKEVAEQFLENPSSVNLYEYMFHEDGLTPFIETISAKRGAPIRMLHALLGYVVGKGSAENKIAYKIIAALLRNVPPHRLKFFDRNWRNRAAFYEYCDELYRMGKYKDILEYEYNCPYSAVSGLASAFRGSVESMH